MPTEQERTSARKRAAEVRRAAPGKGVLPRLLAAHAGHGAFTPAVIAESEEDMTALARSYGISCGEYDALCIDGAEHRLVPIQQPCYGRGPFIPSPGAYLMIVDGPVPGVFRRALEEAVEARRRDGGRGLSPDWLRDELPELDREPYLRYGALPGDATYLCRTPGGTIFVYVYGDRKDALHSHIWETPMREPVTTFVAFAPDGTLAEMSCLRAFAGFAAAALYDDARDVRYIPGADAMELLRTSDRLDYVKCLGEEHGAELYYDILAAAGGRLAGKTQEELRETAVRFRDLEYARRRREAAERGRDRDKPAEEPERQTFASAIRYGVEQAG